MAPGSPPAAYTGLHGDTAVITRTTSNIAPNYTITRRNRFPENVCPFTVYFLNYTAGLMASDDRQAVLATQGAVPTVNICSAQSRSNNFD
tara:strand:- start:179 stop:448 length:270 start_codon:yes stop_codon:yes gene_type:complete